MIYYCKIDHEAGDFQHVKDHMYHQHKDIRFFWYLIGWY